MNNQEILDLVFYSGDLGKDVTIRKWFEAIVMALWEEQESFSGKRPLGNSGWDGDLVACLIRNNLIPGSLDVDGEFIEDVNWEQAHDFVAKKIIPELFKKL